MFLLHVHVLTNVLIDTREILSKNLQTIYQQKTVNTSCIRHIQILMPQNINLLKELLQPETIYHPGDVATAPTIISFEGRFDKFGENLLENMTTARQN